MAAAKVTVTTKVSWVPGGGDSIVLAGSDSFSQAGNDASERTQTFTSTTSTLVIGACTGDKYIHVKNTVDLGTSPTQTQIDNATLYLDVVTPVVPGATTSQHKIPPGKSVLTFTAVDTWYAISGSAGATAIVGAVEK